MASDISDCDTCIGISKFKFFETWKYEAPNIYSLQPWVDKKLINGKMQWKVGVKLTETKVIITMNVDLKNGKIDYFADNKFILSLRDDKIK